VAYAVLKILLCGETGVAAVSSATIVLQILWPKKKAKNGTLYVQAVRNMFLKKMQSCEVVDEK
jgi:hypothetical protein